MKKVLIHERLSPDVLFASSLYDNDNRIVGTRIAFDRQEIHLVNKKSFFFRNRTVDCDFLIIENQKNQDPNYKNDQPKNVAVIAEAQLNR